jgi:hypothetical protein
MLASWGIGAPGAKVGRAEKRFFIAAGIVTAEVISSLLLQNLEHKKNPDPDPVAKARRGTRFWS